MPRARGPRNVPTAGAIGAVLVLAAAVTVVGQQQFQFIVSATDAEQKPITDLKAEEVLMSENGVANKIIKLEPFRVPVKLTITVDNGPQSRDALAHYRTGLTGLVKALPPEVEVTLISTAPQPRMVVRPTTQREQILRGINGFAPEDESPRFTDSLVEFSKRYQKELEDTKKADSLPVLVMISTTANEAVSYQVPEIQRALGFLKARKAKVYVTMTTGRDQDVQGLSQLNTSRQALIAIPATEATGGRYEALSITNRLATLLPEFGEQIAALHRKHYNQVLVTAQRPGVGPLQNPRIELTRPGLTGQVSLDGLP
jgi:hypothetical protein